MLFFCIVVLYFKIPLFLTTSILLFISPKNNKKDKIKKPATSYSPRSYDQVPSAQAGLTSLFEMGRGVAPPLLSPTLSQKSIKSIKLKVQTITRLLDFRLYRLLVSENYLKIIYYRYISIFQIM